MNCRLFLLKFVLLISVVLSLCSNTCAAGVFIYNLDCDKSIDSPALSAIQGVLAKNDIRLYLADRNDFWAEEIRKTENDVMELMSFEELFARFNRYLDKYVICDNGNYSIGASVAVTFDAFVISDEALRRHPIIEKYASQVYDVRGKDEYWLLQYVHDNLDKYSLKAITQHNPKKPAALIDYAIANRYICVVCEDNPDLMRKFYSMIEPGSPKFGFGTPYHNELKDVALGAEYGLYTVPSANTMNLSFFSGTEAEARQRKSGEKLQVRGKAHYVMIMMSDGDNLNWTVNGCITSDKYLGNEACSRYPFNWMYPPEIMNAAGFVHNYYMNHRPNSNYYIGAVSGQGYTYPSCHKDADILFSKTADSYARAGLEYCVVMDTLNFRTGEKAVLERMTDIMPGLKGVFYMDYGNYAKWKGDTYLIGDVPVHSFRYRLWLPHDPVEEIAAKINASSTDPSSLDAYSSIVVHVWSYGIDDVVRFIEMLNDDVVLVTADQYMNLLYENVLCKE